MAFRFLVLTPAEHALRLAEKLRRYGGWAGAERTAENGAALKRKVMQRYARSSLPPHNRVSVIARDLKITARRVRQIVRGQ